MFAVYLRSETFQAVIFDLCSRIALLRVFIWECEGHMSESNFQSLFFDGVWSVDFLLCHLLS